MLEWLVLASLKAATAFELHVEQIRTVQTDRSMRLKKYENERSSIIQSLTYTNVRATAARAKSPWCCCVLGGDCCYGVDGGKFGIRCGDVTGDKRI